MITRKTLISKLIFAATASFPQLSASQDFTSATVLDWDPVSQNALFQPSITMTNIVAMRTGEHDQIVTCINDWYGTEDQQAERHDEILRVLADYPEHHPQGIILAVIEKACGKF
ncbi:hypothetical protein RA27_10135 [Ruegeria sp. ANG-R]|uniref:hypothetical protein n=1 Tax=Ruegeria sp. ANG-R TaxID=1577903 RepID=UPI00057F7B3F|nr:hypothetical protein [Ruegeria sp. ANG-R]KIC41586.1 hypothetical protein RA27_10135 [Ruegeria sp. ANG-R]